MSKKYELTGHLCRACSGRLLRHVGDDGDVTIRCSNCGATGDGSICWCGFRLSEGKKTQLFRCQPNENRSPATPGEIEVVVMAQ